MWHNVFFGVSGMRRVTPPSEDSVLNALASMDEGYLGAPFVRGQISETDAEMFGLDFGYMGAPFCAVWGGDSILEMLAGMNAGYLGAPFVCGQVNETDAQAFGLDFGYMGGPLVAWSNE